MLDTETKRKIDACRDILVGKVPDPKGQVDQITIALIYKFMDDMDKQSEEWGGKPSFFIGEYERYAWSKIFDPRLGGFDLIALYADAIARMNQNPNVPQLFRDIFKNAYLPYRSPETLKSFLKQINEFHYDHSERLGDAYEYLLSILSSQGDAGMFRTPRHIIDFIVKIVDPKKNEAVLDPACGTAGFLISSYRHILKANTEKKNGDKLTPTEKKRLLNNFVGYDISPDMVRLSLVNMYLHGFANPKIHEYDTLSSEQRWNDTADVIMANPPFMTPKGGIRPHKRFSIQAKRSEALFVDYIAEHLNPHGRAGVIVPEGIIFKSENAYKQLRKMLADNFLWCVVSLPAGVFNPYAGVKTSILLMDKQLSKKTDYILFVKIENDGFDLGAKRREVDKNDLPKALEYIKQYQKELLGGHISEDTAFAHSVEKSKITESGDWNLSGERYRVSDKLYNSDFELIELGKVCQIKTGKKDVNQGNPNGKYPFFTCAKEHTFCDEFSFDTEALLIAGNGDVGAVKYYKGKFEAYQRTYVLSGFKEVIAKYLFFLLANVLKATVSKQKLGNTMPYIKLGMLQNFQIPLPPLEVQEAIVAEIDGYQKIIDGAGQVVENYKPTIKIDPSWPMVAIGKCFDKTTLGLVRSKGEQKSEYPHPYVKMDNITENGELDLSKLVYVQATGSELEGATLNDGDFIYNTRNAPKLVGKCTVYHGENGRYLFNNNILQIKFKEELNPDFANYYLNSEVGKAKIRRLVSGTTSVAAIYQKNFSTITIPLPPLSVQQEIVAQIEAEQKIVNANKKLIDIYEQKIKAKIAEVWGFGTSQATVEKKAYETADSGLLIAEVAEHYRTDVSLACLVLQHFKERGKTIREFHLQKYAYIAQQHLKLPIVSEFQPMAAGPWSSAFKNYACACARQQQWFSLKGRNVEPGKALKAGTAEAEKILGRQRGKVLQLLDDLKRFGDSGLERWATILMVVSQLKAARKAVTRWNIQEAIDNWSGKRNKEWFTKISVSKAIDGMNQKGWIKLIGE